MTDCFRLHYTTGRNSRVRPIGFVARGRYFLVDELYETIENPVDFHTYH